MSDIKETMVLKSKEVDKYFNEMKKLVTLREQLELEEKEAKKRLKNCKNSIKSWDNWIKTK